jgi:hypothetical protein
VKRVVLALSLLSLVASASAEKWSFVVAGDGRSDGTSGQRSMDRGGVNDTITREIAQAVIREKAKMLAWTGDLAIGSKDPVTFERQLLVWRGLMQPVYDKKIKVLPCRGNHELGPGADAARVWGRVFTGPYALPQNGPATEKNLSFYFEKGDVLLIGLDHYAGTVRETVNQPWLDQVLTERKKPFIFAFGHEHAFSCGAHRDTLDTHPVNRDAFWESLIRAGSRAYFCGHDHLYDHMTVTRGGSNPGPVMHQFVAGTSGAPFYKAGAYAGQNTIWQLDRQKKIENTYGYILVEIDGKRATITFKGRVAPGKYQAMDSWSYTAD